MIRRRPSGARSGRGALRSPAGWSDRASNARAPSRKRGSSSHREGARRAGQCILVLLDGPPQLAGRSAAIARLADSARSSRSSIRVSTSRGAVVGRQLEGEPIGGWLVVRQVDVVFMPSPGERNIEPLSTLGTRDHGVCRVDGGALGAVDGAGVPELHVVPDIFGRQPEHLAEPASLMTRPCNVEVAVAVDASNNPAIPVLHPRHVAAANGAVIVPRDDVWGDCGLVFTTRLGDPVDPRNFHRDFKVRAAKAGVPVVPIHSTRRTCASLLVALDVHPRVAMAVLRHSRIALTMEIYSQVSSTATRDALRRLGGELSGS